MSQASLDSWLRPGRVDSVLYDRVKFLAGQEFPVRLRLFCTPFGQRCPYTGKVRTVSDTNMVMAGMLPPPRSFMIGKLGWLIAPTSPMPVVPEAEWRFVIGQRIYACGPLRLDAGWGMVNLKPGWKGARIEDPKTLLAEGASVLFQEPLSLRELPDNKLLILPQMSFSVEVAFDERVAKQDMEFWCVLVGTEDCEAR